MGILSSLFGAADNGRDDHNAWDASARRAVANISETSEYQAQLAVEAERQGDVAGAEVWRNRSRENAQVARDIAASARNPLF
jgi:uncharacterized protein YuzE